LDPQAVRPAARRPGALAILLLIPAGKRGFGLRRGRARLELRSYVVRLEVVLWVLVGRGPGELVVVFVILVAWRLLVLLELLLGLTCVPCRLGSVVAVVLRVFVVGAEDCGIGQNVARTAPFV